VPLDVCFSLPGLFGGSPGDNYILQSEVPGCLSPPRPAQTLEIVLPICAIVLLLLGFACIRRRWDRSLQRLGIKAVAWLGSFGVAVAAVLRRLAGAVARVVQRAKYWPGRLGIQFQPANLQVYYGPSEADKTKHREIIAKAKISAILIVCCYAGLLGCFIGTRYYRGFVSQLVNTLGIHTSFLSVARLEDTIVGRCQAAIALMPCLYIPHRSTCALPIHPRPKPPRARRLTRPPMLLRSPSQTRACSPTDTPAHAADSVRGLFLCIMCPGNGRDPSGSCLLKQAWGGKASSW